MLKNDYGRIVNIASVAGKEGNPNASAYSTSKAAVIGLTKSLGKELAETGVRVNCVTPAAVRTPIFDADDAGAHRLHAVEDSAGPLRRASTRSRRWLLARERGVLVQHRRGVRSFGRTRDLLIMGTTIVADLNPGCHA